MVLSDQRVPTVAPEPRLIQTFAGVLPLQPRKMLLSNPVSHSPVYSRVESVLVFVDGESPLKAAGTRAGIGWRVRCAHAATKSETVNGQKDFTGSLIRPSVELLVRNPLDQRASPGTNRLAESESFRPGRGQSADEPYLPGATSSPGLPVKREQARYLIRIKQSVMMSSIILVTRPLMGDLAAGGATYQQRMGWIGEAPVRAERVGCPRRVTPDAAHSLLPARARERLCFDRI